MTLLRQRLWLVLSSIDRTIKQDDADHMPETIKLEFRSHADDNKQNWTKNTHSGNSCQLRDVWMIIAKCET